MKTEKEIIHLSKFLSLILRHKPETIDLSLQENGWADTTELIEKCNHHGYVFDFDTLKIVVDTNQKKRFSFNDDFKKIRANQGHSMEIDLGYPPKLPPKILFHGIATKNVESILKTGLEKRDRHHVHLSDDLGTAINVGKRHGKPVVFEIQTTRMIEDQFVFYQADNGVWLTDCVPSAYLSTNL
jgi:putative RNA 2'-phosphotransferase